jgi:hypothetical protein
MEKRKDIIRIITNYLVLVVCIPDIKSIYGKLMNDYSDFPSNHRSMKKGNVKYAK